MKLGPRFKALLLWTSAILYITGLAVWLIASRFQVQGEYGPEPSPLKLPILHAHSVAGLVFLVLFGYLWRDHVEPGLKRSKKKRSGLTLIAALAVLFATVPMLFYLTGDAPRAWTAAVHTWLGAILLAPFVYHLRSKTA
ncbi:MAG TPA: hypothetical protein VN915_11075 [Elusimicrobiota bacterium]|nr:hypothetical protein [Elusimicrobiota bacterium]